MPQYLSREGKDFIRRALAMQPEERLTAAEMLHHPWIEAHCGQWTSSNGGYNAVNPANAPGFPINDGGLSGGAHDVAGALAGAVGGIVFGGESGSENASEGGGAGGVSQHPSEAAAAAAAAHGGDRPFTSWFKPLLFCFCHLSRHQRLRLCTV